MTLLRLRKLSTDSYRIVVHLDATKVDAAGKPDPLWLMVFTLPPKPAEVTQGEYLQQERLKVRASCLRRLAELEATEGNALTGEGDSL